MLISVRQTMAQPQYVGLPGQEVVTKEFRAVAAPFPIAAHMSDNFAAQVQNILCPSTRGIFTFAFKFTAWIVFFHRRAL